MPSIEKHRTASLERTGKDFLAVHEWLDGNPEKKAERHDITRIYTHGKLITELYGEEGLQEYIRHIHDDLKAKFEHIRHDLDKTMADTLAYFGVK